VNHVLCIQANFVHSHCKAAIAYAAACAAVAAAGFYIFRAANAQKDLFKRDPRHASLRGLATIATPAGNQLLAGGWFFVERPSRR
jgi:delta14-sterol reductase